MLSFSDFTQFCFSETEFIADKLRGFNDDLKCSYKNDGTEVTVFDLQFEDYLRRSITKKFPNHGILGEERPPHNSSAKMQWILDPIDGTYGFSRGLPLWGTLIGLLENNEPKYGFLRLPLLDNSWVSGNGSEALLNGNLISNRPHSSWEHSLILTTDQQTIEKSPMSCVWQQALKLGATARTWGDCYGYFLLCSGKAEMMADTGLKPYDVLPLIPILLGSGIEVHQLGCSDYRNIVACKKGVWQQLI